ncbi:alpha-L-fucosidase [Pseudochryseolinea flava]|uniref:alpha-L-fucosidase n=1 Tax=Pseudochryseolinea flava TaxID=2059302 RepID=A0A364XZ35_9BACT|nr:alpha-L-fucosidase [Pseudochryseolinea flava]RAV98701.1 glycoside hydrolase family 29 [Pseudochryseolinea flava]
MVKSQLTIASMVVSLFACTKEVSPPAPVNPIPTAAQLAWHEMETNAFIHFTINTFTDKEWGYGDESPALFNPSQLNADQWVTTLKEAGFKGIILTTKHHDGFCLWPSKFNEHNVKNSPYKNGEGDLVKEVSDACKRHDLKFGIYMSPWDRNHPQYGTPAYVQYYRNQLHELFTQYGPVFEMWFDGANGGDGFYGGTKETRRIQGATYYDWPTTLRQVEKLEPNVIFFSDAGPGVRWVGNERGVAGETNWNTITPDTLFAGKAGIEDLLQRGHPDGTTWIPAEVDVSIRPGWFYHAKEDSLVKSAEKLFDIYLTSVGRGSTLLLNVPPDKRGLIHERDIAVLRAWRNMIDNAFKTNHARHAKASATNVRGQMSDYNADKIVDNNKETYWATDDNVTAATVELELNEPVIVKFIVMQEFISLGQRVKKFKIEAQQNGSWQTIGSGTTIGYKRILEVDHANTKHVRITIEASRACPLLSNVEIY